MTACFEAGSNNELDSGFFKSDRFGWRRGGSNRNDALDAALVENLLRWNSDDEAEDGHFGVEQDTRLVFKFVRNVGLVFRERTAHGFDMLRNMGEAALKFLLAGGAG